MVTREWTAVHRKHHVACETEDDPHSPVIQGIGEIMWRGVESYQRASRDEALLNQYGKGCPDDWMERHVYSKPWGIAVMLVINVALFGVLGLTVWAVQMAWIPFFAAGVINGIGHWWGYRNFECPDAARNIFPWGILIGGEELHNNHHTYPNSAKLSAKPFEFDIGWAWIKLFASLGWAKVISTGPVVEQVPGKQSIDKDTAWALLNDRFRVMARYAEEVVAPAIAAERAKADEASRKLLRRAKKLLCREQSLLDQRSQERRAALVAGSTELKVVSELYDALHEIWAKRGGNVDDIIHDIADWCHRAEASGMQALHEFAETLKSYAPRTATA